MQQSARHGMSDETQVTEDLGDDDNKGRMSSQPTLKKADSAT